MRSWLGRASWGAHHRPQGDAARKLASPSTTYPNRVVGEVLRGARREVDRHVASLGVPGDVIEHGDVPVDDPAPKRVPDRYERAIDFRSRHDELQTASKEERLLVSDA